MQTASERAALLTTIEQGSLSDLRKLLAELVAGLYPALTVTGTTTLGGLVLANVAVTAAASPGADIPADAGMVTITSANANHWVNLPEPVIGKVLFLSVGANGCEVRTSDPATIAINGNTPTANSESALPAQTFAMLVCKSATSWVGWDLTGTTFAAIEAAAV